MVTAEEQAMSNKIQRLFINELLKEGQVELVLPTGMTLEVGITQEGANGGLEKQADYCWLIASQDNRSVSIDQYTFGLRFSKDSDRMICSDDIVSYDGQQMRVFDVV